MDDSRALAGVLDRLAAVRRADAPHRSSLRAGTAYGSVPGRAQMGLLAPPDRLRLIQWSAGGFVHRAGGPSRDAMVDDCVRRTFALLNEFREAFQHRADPHWLAILLQAIGQDATYTFDTAAKVRRESAEFSADKARCLADLEQLHRALRGPSPPSEHDLAHAMDALIVQLIRVQPGP